MPPQYTYFATVPIGFEGLLAAELSQLGASEVAETRSGVAFAGPLEVGYRACLWSRLASRVLLRLDSFAAADEEQLYSGLGAIPWEDHLTAQSTLAVTAVTTRSQINHSRFAALRAKDAIVDRFRRLCGERPSVSVERPDVRVNLHLDRDVATVAIDLSGESLHRRGYREEGVEAPLKENLAAAILLRAGWPEIAADGGALVDPMCGSGTLPIEAALMATDTAPGLLRDYFGFTGWSGHDPALWEELLVEARQRLEAGRERPPRIVGYDADPRAVKAAWANAQRAGLEKVIHVERRQAQSLEPPTGAASKGLVVANPPYGERLGDVATLIPLYQGLGACLRQKFCGWKASVITSNPELGKNLGIRARKIHSLYNGSLQCQLLHFEIDQRWFFRELDGADGTSRPQEQRRHSEGAQMFANRLRKNLRTVGRWARRSDVECYRLYDADMPEYAVAVDLYGDRVHVQEYQAPKTVDAGQALTRMREVKAVLPEVLDVPRDRVFFKVRQKQAGTAQYEKVDTRQQFFEVGEGQARFLVNLSDYLDTGLFLDHRPTREMIRQEAVGKRFLNLFAYTGTVSVCAALGGAVSTTSVDMSRTYLDWARRNLALNGFSGDAHRLIQKDCLAWMQEEPEGGYDLIFLDPPTFSNSKRMEETFDVQRDHVHLIRSAVRLLSAGGMLIFSNNNRRFKLDRETLADLSIADITAQTIAKDFERNPRIHNCWRIVRGQGMEN